MANFGADTSRDQMLERPLPNSAEAERAILGAIILDNALISQAIEQLRSEDFYVPSHRRIFLAMIALFERGSEINQILIAEELRRVGEIESVGGVSYITNLMIGLPHFANLGHFSKIVRDKSMLRQLVKACNKITSEALEEEDEAEIILDHAEQAIFALADERTRQGFAHVKPIADGLLEHVQEMAGRSAMLTGLTTGFNDLDEMTSGLQSSDLIIIAARPSMGKTSFALTLAQNAAINAQAVVGIFSLEMSKESLVMRMLSSEGHVDAHRFRSGFLSREEWARLAGALGTLAETKIFIDDTPGITVLEMRAKARRLAAEQKKLDLIIVDYLQLMSGASRRIESRQQEVSQISRELKALAKELNVPLIALSQLSRAPETRTDHKPQLSDLRESGCLAGESLVTLADTGERVAIRDLVGKSGFNVWALNEETWKIEKAVVSRAFSTGSKPVFRLQTRLGRSIRATGNHKFYTFDGWKRLDELKVGERLALPRAVGSYKLNALSKVKEFISHTTANSNRDAIPSMVWKKQIVPMMREKNISTRQMMSGINTAYCGTGIYKQNISRARASRIAEAIRSEELSLLAKSDVYWDEIVAIELDGTTEVFDLTVEKHHNFVANDLILHNSIEQDADVVAFIYREEQYNRTEENAGIAEILISKQRNGPTGAVKLAFLKEFTRFENMWRE